MPAWLVEGWLLLSGVLLLSYIVGLQLYSWRDVAAERARRRHPHRRQYRSRPFITVVVVAQPASQPEQLTACLRSLRASSYRKLKIIVVDQEPAAPGRQVVRQANRRSRRKITWMSAQPATQSRHWQAAAGSAYRKHGQGELLLIAPADALFPRQSLQLAVQQYNQQAQLADIRLPSLEQSQYSLAGLLYRYRQILQVALFKAKSRGKTYKANDELEYGVLYGAAKTTVAPHTVSHGRRPVALAAEAALIRSAPPSWPAALGVGQATDRLLLRGDGMTGLIALPLTAYAGYMALRLHRPLLLWLEAAVFAFVMALAVTSNTLLGRKQRLRLILGLPLTCAFFVLCAMVAAGRLLARPARAGPPLAIANVRRAFRRLQLQSLRTS